MKAPGGKTDLEKNKHKKHKLHTDSEGFFSTCFLFLAWNPEQFSTACALTNHR